MSGAWFVTTTKVLLPSCHLAELIKTNHVEKSPVFISPNRIKAPNNLFFSHPLQNKTKMWSISAERKAELT